MKKETKSCCSGSKKCRALELNGEIRCRLGHPLELSEPWKTDWYRQHVAPLEECEKPMTIKAARELGVPEFVGDIDVPEEFVELSRGPVRYRGYCDDNRGRLLVYKDEEFVAVLGARGWEYFSERHVPIDTLNALERLWKDSSRRG